MSFYVVGFDGSSGRVKGRADSTAVVALPLNTPAVPKVIGYWADTGDPGWTPPRAEVAAIVDEALGDRDCVGAGMDPSGWSEEIAEWQAAHGDSLRTKNIAVGSKARAWAWTVLREGIDRQIIGWDRNAPDFELIRTHVLALKETDFGAGKAHQGPRAGLVDVAAALAYAAVARLNAISAGPKSVSPPPKWPAHVRGESRGQTPGDRLTRTYGLEPTPGPTRYKCKLPDCDQATTAYFCTEEHLARYKAYWPDDPQLTSRGRLVGHAPKRS